MLKIVFMGTAELAVSSLQSLANRAEFQVEAVVTQPDRPQGRDLVKKPSPVKLAAQALGLPVFQPERIRTQSAQDDLAKLCPELIVVAAYGQILPPPLLKLPRYGCLNVHTSLLPKYRGAAPIQWAMLNGDSETGVTLMLMDPGLDTGPILRQQATPILPTDDAQTLHERLAKLGGELLLAVIPEWIAGRLEPMPQPLEGISYARKIEKQDGLLDWRLPAMTLWNRVRGLTPWPGAFLYRQTGEEKKLLKVWRAQAEAADRGEPGEVIAVEKSGILVRCGEGALRILKLQREGGKRLNAMEFLAGNPLNVGERWPLPLNQG